MAALESSLARVLQDFQEDRRRLTAVFGAERAEAQADIRALRQLAKARGRALHKVRPPLTARPRVPLWKLLNMRLTRMHCKIVLLLLCRAEAMLW